MKSYQAASVTLADHTKVYSLSALILALNANFPLTGREVNVQVDAVNSPAGSVARIGQLDTLSTLICGYSLSTGDSRLYRSVNSDIPLSMIGLIGNVDNVVVNVEVCQ